MPGPTELVIILFIVVLLFGAKKLPELAKGLGRGIREFKSAATEIDEATRLDDDAAKRTQRPREE